MLFAIIIIVFNWQEVFATQTSSLKGSFPDYSYEFTGKDPWEGFNRKIFVFNIKANKYIIRPLNIVWASVMPQYGLDRIQGIYKNFNYPARLIGNLLQKDTKSAGIETKRFFINTTIGLAGMYDPALRYLKLEPTDEDIEQALAYRKVKQGPYLVLPIVTQGNTRDVAGWFLDLPLNLSNYLFIIGPASAISGGVSYLNDVTLMQPILELADNNADPYEVSKQLCGIENYIKNLNIDRKEVLESQTRSQNIVPISHNTVNPNLKPDIELVNYNSQGPYVDAMRTMYFDNVNLNNSIWSDLSVWNKSFAKKVKTNSVKVTPSRDKYKYKYILQQNKEAPLAIIYPSIGEGIRSSESLIQAKILYDEGYSVVILGSSFQWEFVKSMPIFYSPGMPTQDAYYLRKVTAKVIDDLERKKDCKFNKKIIIGTSFGGLTALFAAAEEAKENTLGISKYITINPPVEVFFALKQIDKLFEDQQKDFSEFKQKTAITDQKIINVSQEIKENKHLHQPLPFTEDEAKIAISFSMKQKLSDVIFTIEDGKVYKKNNLHTVINNMNFNDYANKYLIKNSDKNMDTLIYESSLYLISDFLKNSQNYKIYNSLDDCFANEKQLQWLKNEAGLKMILFSNGSHLGYLYRQEFLNQFKSDLKNNL